MHLEFTNGHTPQTGIKARPLLNSLQSAQEGLYEEAQLLREREMELKAKLSGAAAAAPVVPVVGTLEIEAIVSAWTGIPVDRLSAADTERLSRLPDALTACFQSFLQVLLG